MAIRYLELPRRLQVTHRPLQISDRQLAALVAAGHSDTDIATRYRVAVWAVVRRRRRSRLLRPPPNKVRPPLTRAQLKRQLAARTRADIATAHNVGLATVTRSVRPLWPRRRRSKAAVGRRSRRRARPDGAAPPIRRRAVVGTTDRRSPRRRRRHRHLRAALTSHPRTPRRQRGPGRRRRAARHALCRPRRHRRPRATSHSATPSSREAVTPLPTSRSARTWPGRRPLPGPGSDDDAHLAAHRAQRHQRLRGAAPPRHRHPTQQSIPLVRTDFPVTC